MRFSAVLPEIHDVIRVERYSTYYLQRKELSLEYPISHDCRRNACRWRGLSVRRMASVSPYAEVARTGLAIIRRRVRRSADETTVRPPAGI
jgi:hypothetical protein